jgi:hypothetical protein
MLVPLGVTGLDCSKPLFEVMQFFTPKQLAERLSRHLSVKRGLRSDLFCLSSGLTPLPVRTFNAFVRDFDCWVSGCQKSTFCDYFCRHDITL